MIQLFTQSKSMELLSAPENSQAVKINSSDHQSEGRFGKQLSDVLQKFMGPGGQTENREAFAGEDGSEVSADNNSIIPNALRSKVSEQIQIRLLPDKQFNLEEPSGESGNSEKFFTGNESVETHRSFIKDSSEGVSLDKILKKNHHFSNLPEIKGQFVQNETANPVSGTTGKTEMSKIKSDGTAEKVQGKNPLITLKEAFVANDQNLVNTEISSKLSEGGIRHSAVTDDGVKIKNRFNTGRSLEGLNIQNSQSSEKTVPGHSHISDNTGNENNQRVSSVSNKPVQNLTNSQAAGISVSKESVLSPEKKSKTSDHSHLSGITGEGERDLLKSTERMDLRQPEKAGHNQTRFVHKMKPVNNFDPVQTQTENKDAEFKTVGEIFRSDSNENKVSNTREPAALRPEQSVVFQQAERRNLSVRLAKIVKQELQSGKAQGQGWKKHQFTLDDGTKVQLSLRKAEGVIQLQLGSVNSELNKLIQQHAQEIRQHLEEQMNAEVNLQFQEASSESGSSLLSDKNSGSEHSDGKNQGGSTNTTGKQLPQEDRRTRLFGFNSNEWTA